MVKTWRQELNALLRGGRAPVGVSLWRLLRGCQKGQPWAGRGHKAEAVLAHGVGAEVEPVLAGRARRAGRGCGAEAGGRRDTRGWWGRTRAIPWPNITSLLKVSHLPPVLVFRPPALALWPHSGPWPRGLPGRLSESLLHLL